MRFVYGMFSQESNSLAPKMTTLASFRESVFLEGEEIARRLEGTSTEIGGIIAGARELEVELIPTVAAHAVASGPVTREAFEEIASRITQGIESAGEIDGVVLALHGAMMVEGDDDGTGELLRRVRAVVSDRIPIVGALDLHANLTRRMASAADTLVAYHTYPHVDGFEMGKRAVELALLQAGGEIRPRSALRRLPMILPAENSATTRGPMKELIAHAEEIERRPRVLGVSICPTQPWLNLPDMACAVLVTTDDDSKLAESYADELGERFWRLRHEFYDLEIVSPTEAIHRAVEAKAGPIVFADSADGTGSGASGDSTVILEALMSDGATVPSYLSIVDPEAVRACEKAGVGSTVSLVLGGTIDRAHYRPLRVTGRVRLVSDGVFTYKGPQFTGQKSERGLTAVLQIGAVQVVVTERTTFNWDPEYYRSLGLDPFDARIVVVKSPTAYRAAYASVMKDSITVDAPGAARANILALEGELDRVRRPIFPFDDLPDELALEMSRSGG